MCIPMRFVICVIYSTRVYFMSLFLMMIIHFCFQPEIDLFKYLILTLYTLYLNRPKWRTAPASSNVEKSTEILKQTYELNIKHTCPHSHLQSVAPHIHSQTHIHNLSIVYHHQTLRHSSIYIYILFTTNRSNCFWHSS